MGSGAGKTTKVEVYSPSDVDEIAVKSAPSNGSTGSGKEKAQPKKKAKAKSRTSVHMDKGNGKAGQNRIAEKSSAPAFFLGDEVQARFRGGKAWVKGTITYAREDGSFDIRYQNGEGEDAVDPSMMRFEPAMDEEDLMEQFKVDKMFDAQGKLELESKISDIRSKPGLKRALDVLAYEMDQGVSVEDVFSVIDRDGSGDLTKDEMIEGFMKYGVKLGVMQMRILFDAFDTDGNGTIDFQEFSGLMQLWREGSGPVKTNSMRDRAKQLKKQVSKLFGSEDEATA